MATIQTRIWFMLVCGFLFTLMGAVQSYAIGVSISTGTVQELVKLFTDAGMSTPSITFTETASQFNLSIIGGPVNSTLFNHTLSFDTDFVATLNGAEYWKGHFGVTTVNPSSIFVEDDDSITVAGNIFHQAVNGLPDPTDALAGGIFTYSSLADSSTAKAAGNITGTPAISGTKDHLQNNGSLPHHDIYNGSLTATVAFISGVGGDNHRITRWTFELTGDHKKCIAPPSPAPFVSAQAATCSITGICACLDAVGNVIYVTEGQTGVSTFTVFNNGPNAKIAGIDVIQEPTVGDATDFANMVFPLEGTCALGAVFAAGGTCTVVVPFVTDTPDVGPLFDGTTPFDLTFSVDDGRSTTATSFVVVSDIPEPSTWLMFGTGLIALLAYGWRRKQHAA